MVARLKTTYTGLLSWDDSEGPALERLLALALIRVREQSYCHILDYCFDSVNLELIKSMPLRKVPENSTERQGLRWTWLTLVDVRTRETARREWSQRIAQ
jgi:hypothetical protein